MGSKKMLGALALRLGSELALAPAGMREIQRA